MRIDDLQGRQQGVGHRRTSKLESSLRGHPDIPEREAPEIVAHAPMSTRRIDSVTTDAAEATTTVPTATSDAVS